MTCTHQELCRSVDTPDHEYHCCECGEVVEKEPASKATWRDALGMILTTFASVFLLLGWRVSEENGKEKIAKIMTGAFGEHPDRFNSLNHE